MIADPMVPANETALPPLPLARPAASRDRLIIVNPAAGRRRAGGLAALARRLRQELACEVAITRSYAHIAELLGAARGARDVAVFGGDGTLAEAINHMDLGAQRLLLLPGGTGNGLARDLGLTTLERALAAYRAGACRAIDLLEVTLRTARAEGRRLALSTASFGYVSDTVVRARRLPRALGAWRYSVAAVLQAAQMRTRPVRVTFDGGATEELRLTNLVVNNTRHLGNFCGFRRASLGDGRADVQLAANGFRQQVLQNLGLLTRTYLWRRGQELSARTVRVSSPEPLRLMLDGEIWEDVSEAEFRVLPGRLRVYAAA